MSISFNFYILLRIIMVVKKTVKKAPVKKVITKKVPVKNVITKPTVTVETKRISKSDPCCTLGFSSCFSFKIFLLLFFW